MLSASPTRSVGRSPRNEHLDELPCLDQVGSARLAEEQPPLKDLREDCRLPTAEVGAVAEPHIDDAEEVESLDCLTDRRAPDSEPFRQVRAEGILSPGPIRFEAR